MATSKQINEFYARWFPTIRSFARLYLGDEDEGVAAAVHAFCEYVRTGLPFETDELPLVLWECAAESVQNRAPNMDMGRMPGSGNKRTEFDKAVMLLNTEQRLAFLLHTVYGLPHGWIMLITGWSTQTVVALCEAGSARVRDALQLSSMRRSRLTATARLSTSPES